MSERLGNVNMIRTKIMTTKQKKFLEKMLSCLDMTLDEFLYIQNLKEEKEKLEKELAEMRVKNENLVKLVDNVHEQNKTLIDAYNNIVTKLNEINVNSIFGDVYNDFNKGVSQQ